MACIEEIAKDAKHIKIEDQLLGLIKRQVEIKLMLEEKFRYLCEEVSNFVKESEDVVKEIRMLSSELNLFGGPLAVQCAEYLKKLSKTEVLRMLELRKTIKEVHIQVHKKIDFLTVLKFY
ncbi:hypothetical protein Tco_1324836 [Tanacetum coccineum]